MENSIGQVQETFENGKAIAEIYLNSKLTIQSDLNKLVETMLPLFDRNNQIYLFSQKNSEIDISFIQIVIAAKKYAQIKNVQLHLNIHLSDVSKDLIELSDFKNIFKKQVQ